MSNKKEANLPELLAPAGSFEHLKAAILAGADAVYLGGSKFGARAYANNFSEEELIEGIYYAHLHDRRIYLTVNTLMTDSEVFGELYDFLKPYYEAGLDGVIVQDMGTIAFIRKHFPEMEIHGSTQMTITTAEGAEAAKRMGMNRVVPARELSLQEICKIKKQTGLEIEVFIHGALCYCYSGQCLLSAVYGGRSGNRGRCAQPCRLPYQVINLDGQVRKADNYLLSPKDLCTLTYIPAMVENGMDSLKIEGRMKNTDFVAGVVSIYRKYLDYYAGLSDKSEYKVDPKDMAALEELFSRSGFTEGYFYKHNGREMMSMGSPNHQGRKVGKIQSIRKNRITVKLSDEIHAKDILVIPFGGKEREEVILTVPNELDGTKSEQTVQLNVSNAKSIKPGMTIFRRKNMEISNRIEREVYQKDISRFADITVCAKAEQPITVKATSGDTTVTVSGETPETAQGKPITSADIEKQMRKTGTVPFQLNTIDIDLDENLFLPMSAIKKLRQNTYAALEEALKTRFCRTAPEQTELTLNSDGKTKERGEDARFIVTVYNLEILRACLAKNKIDGICIPMDFWGEQAAEKACHLIQESKKKAYLSLPRIIREKDFDGKNYSRKEIICKSWDGYYAHQINEAELLYDYQNSGMIADKAEIILGSSLYQWNEEAHQEILRLFSTKTIPVTEVPMEFSVEEVEEQLEKISEETEVLVYGHYPVMISAQCLNKNSAKCTKKSEQFFLKDRKGRKLPVSTHCRECFNIIWTDKPRNWTEFLPTLKKTASRLRMDLFHCELNQLDELLNKF